jgi:copper homeostasis protein CutC
MTNFSIRFYLLIVALSLFSSCDSTSTQVENKLNELLNKTEALDSLINHEVDKVLTLDSLIIGESDKIKRLDSLINKNASKLDSIASNKLKVLDRVLK